MRKYQSSYMTQIKLGLIMGGIGLLVLLAQECFGQTIKKTIKKEDMRSFHPEVIEAGKTIIGITKFFEANGKKPFFSNGDGERYDRLCEVIYDFRVNNQMTTFKYEFFYKNDTCKYALFRANPGEDYINSNYDFVEEVDKGDRDIRKYKAKSGNQQFWIVLNKGIPVSYQIVY
jgi:hypothetical protein